MAGSARLHAVRDADKSFLGHMNPIVAARELKEQEDTRASGGVSGKTRGKSGKLKHVSAMKTGNFESVPMFSDANSGGPGAGGLFVPRAYHG